MTQDIKVFGLFGFPLSHTVSPAMQNAALRTLKIPGIYLPFERTEKQFLKLLKTGRKFVLDGFNLTVPHKEIILPFLDRLDRTAQLAGAANTILKRNYKWVGYNTDIDGFCAGLREKGFRPEQKSVVILGAGGAARAVVVALALGKVKRIAIFNRTQRRAIRLAKEFGKRFPKVRLIVLSTQIELKNELNCADLLVNATSLGLRPSDPNPLPVPFPKKRLLAYDLIYGKCPTKFLRAARAAGNSVISGETMLVGQGARAFEIWTGRQAPVLIMRKALHDAL